MKALNALYIIIALTIIVFGCLRYEGDKKFKIWFEEVKRQAPFYGFTEEDIEDFESIVWRTYFDLDYTEENAIKKYLLDN